MTRPFTNPSHWISAYSVILAGSASLVFAALFGRLVARTALNVVSADKAGALLKALFRDTLFEGFGLFVEGFNLATDLPSAEAQMFPALLRPWLDPTSLRTFAPGTLSRIVWNSFHLNPNRRHVSQADRLPDSLLNDGWWLDGQELKPRQISGMQIERTLNGNYPVKQVVPFSIRSPFRQRPAQPHRPERKPIMSHPTLEYLFKSRILHFVLMLILFFCLIANAGI